MNTEFNAKLRHEICTFKIIIIIIRIHLLSANYHENVQMRYKKGYNKNYYMNLIKND